MSLSFDADVAAKLAKLNESSQSIQSLSLWLIFHRKQHERAHAAWRSELSKGKKKKRKTKEIQISIQTRTHYFDIVASPAQQLTLLYLANDVLQSARKKGTEVRD